MFGYGLFPLLLVYQNKFSFNYFQSNQIIFFKEISIIFFKQIHYVIFFMTISTLSFDLLCFLLFYYKTDISAASMSVMLEGTVLEVSIGGFLELIVICISPDKSVYLVVESEAVICFSEPGSRQIS